MNDKNYLKITTISSIDIRYEELGKGTNCIVFLHGWGQSHAFWQSLTKRLSIKYHLFILDLPGFGLSQEPPKIWNLDDYAEFIHKFLIKMGIKNPIIIGHSFGGRITSVYATKFPVKRLVLYSNGGLPIISVKMKINKYFVVPLGKCFFPNFLYKSHTLLFKPKQYENRVIITTKRSRRMLDIYTQPFQNLTDIFTKIKVKTLIITGNKDFIASPRIGREMHVLIKNSLLVEIPNATHFAHIEKSDKFFNALKQFLNKS